MTNHPLETTHPLTSGHFRAGQRWELVPFDQLETMHQQTLGELLADPELFGIARPRPPWTGNVKALNRDTALLLYSLSTPGPLPFYVRRDPEAARSIPQLLLDGLLEVEVEGEYLAGANALAFCGEAAGGRAHLLSELSFEAVKLAAATRLLDPAAMADELYHFHRQPVSPRWASRLADHEAVLAFAGLAPRSPARREAELTWKIRPGGEPMGWIYFERRGAARAATALPYKLYVSPQIEALPQVLRRTLTVAARRAVTHGKLGADAAGLLRPDKLVFYLESREQLLTFARELEGELAGLPAHGVPFTAPIDAAGLLSWGADPPASERTFSWQGPESWRTWLVSRLAAALAAADTNDAATAARFALERLRAEGVDIERWLPTATLWQAA